MMQAMGRAAKAHDTDRFMVAFLHQPTLTSAVNGEVIHGWDALHAQQLKWWRHGKTDAVYTHANTIGETEFMQLDPTTVIMTKPLAKRWTLPNGKVSTDTGVVTDIWKKLPEGWRIIYDHESWTPPR